MARKEIEHFRTIVGPGNHLMFAVGRHTKGDVAFHLRDVDVNANLFQLRFDHFPNFGVGDKRAADSDQLKGQALPVIGAQAEPFAVFLSQSQSVEDLVGPSDIQLCILFVPLGTGAVDRIGRGRDRAGRTDAEPEGLVDLIAVNTH